MEIPCFTSFSSSSKRICKYIKTNHSSPTFHQQRNPICFNSRIHFNGEIIQSYSWKLSARKKIQCAIKLSDEPAKATNKKGTIAGAVALIIGTSIGTGILALPEKTSPAGLIPSSISMTLCWGFLLIEALILAEINVGMLRKKKTKVLEDELEIISIRTMAQETLGEWGGVFASVTYVFLGYTSMVAYISKSGEILYHLIDLPESVSGFLFASLFTILISVGGTQVTDRVNQWLTATMIGLLVAIEVLAVSFRGWSGFGSGGNGHWEKVPGTIPVIIFSLVYHDLSPVICAYLGGDLHRIRTSLLLGSVVPLLLLLVWDAIAFDLSAQANQVIDPVELLSSMRWGGGSFMVEIFALLAVGTSMIGTLLSFCEFFKEQINNFFLHSFSARVEDEYSIQKLNILNGLGNWWGKHRVSFAATTLALAPSLFVATTVPNAFSAATDIAGGYCMTMLYGILPPAMAWATYIRNDENPDQTTISGARPVLIGVGLFSCLIVLEQVLQDLSRLYS